MPDLTDPEVREALSDRDGYLGEAARRVEEQVEEDVVDFEDDDGGGGGEENDNLTDTDENKVVAVGPEGERSVVGEVETPGDPATTGDTTTGGGEEDSSFNPSEEAEELFEGAGDEPDVVKEKVNEQGEVVNRETASTRRGSAQLTDTGMQAPEDGEQFPGINPDAPRQVRRRQRTLQRAFVEKDKAEQVREDAQFQREVLQNRLDSGNVRNEEAVQARINELEQVEQQAQSFESEAGDFLDRYDTSQPRDPLNNEVSQQNQRIEVDGVTGNATEEGQEFLRETTELRKRPTFALDEPSVTGALIKEGVVGQAAEAGETFAETGLQRATPDFLNPLIKENVNDIAGLGVEGEKGRPREAFQESLPALSVAQQRSSEILDDFSKEYTTENQRETLTDSTVTLIGELQGSSPAGPFGDVAEEITQGPGRPLAEEAVSKTPEFAAKEIPEKITESASLAGAAAAGLRDPERLGKEIAAGSVGVTKDAVKNPVEFGVGEIGVDVGLDLLTGGGAAVTVPNVKPVGRKTGSTVRETVSTLRDMRQSNKETPGLFDAAVDRSVMSLPERQVMSVDTAESVPEPGPASTRGPQSRDNPFDGFDSSPDLLQPSKSQSQPVTETRSSPGAAVSSFTGFFAGPDTVSRADAFADPTSDVFSFARTESIAEPISEVFALPQAVSEAVPQQVAEPIAEPVPKSQPRSLFRSGFEDEDDFIFEDDIADQGEDADLGNNFTPSLTAGLFDIVAEEEFDEEEFTGTGLGIRPLLPDNENRL